MVWTEAGALVVTVQYDCQFWRQTLLPNLILFFGSFVVPEILTERIKNGLSLFDDYDSVQDDSGVCEFSRSVGNMDVLGYENLLSSGTQCEDDHKTGSVGAAQQDIDDQNSSCWSETTHDEHTIVMDESDFYCTHEETY